MTDLDIINKFKDKKQIKYFIFEKLYPLEYEYLINRFNDSLCLKESLLRVLYNINEHPKCPICGKKTGELTGNEVVKNFDVQCPRKIEGKAHRFVINSQSE